MCSRISQAFEFADLSRLMPEPGRSRVKMRARYNIGPKQLILTITRDDDKTGIESQWVASYMRWGVKPEWSDGVIVNARIETYMDKTSLFWRQNWTRCLVPVSGFYEWKRENKALLPYYIHQYNGKPLLVGALTQLWPNRFRSVSPVVVLLTTQADDDMRIIHHRMPFLIDETHSSRWLTDETFHPVDASKHLVHLQGYRVSNLVKNPANDGLECIQPYTP